MLARLAVRSGYDINVVLLKPPLNHSKLLAAIVFLFGSLGVPALRGASPIVAIHDSELTRALESMPTSFPFGPGTTGYQWWPTNWHYFVMPESVKEALTSDGTAFTVVGDSNIIAGVLTNNDGSPAFPIVISLASEAISDSEVAQFTNYVAAGGTLFIGSSAFTRNTDGSSRGDFAFADAMGVHMASASLGNYTDNQSFTKLLNHRLVSHIPGGVLRWRMPTSAEEISGGISPTHQLIADHLLWRVQATDATVIAQGDAYPYVTVKSYGQGNFIYDAATEPLLGHGGFAPTMYAYVIFRKAIEWAFESSKMPVPKLSPWPYAYDAALNVRHDFENWSNGIVGIEASAQFEQANGAKGDYYFCTGTLRVQMTNSASTIASLRRAVTDYGATIGPHNGGLPNPSNGSLSLGDLDYFHWGPDEVLDVTPTGYASGQAYAFASISNSFLDVEGWLSGITNGLRSWVAPTFNATREASYQIQEALGVKTSGEQKLSPFPSWVLSTSLQTAGKRYPFISLPTSEWFRRFDVSESIDQGSVQSPGTIREMIDYYYSLGALINAYSHCSAASTLIGDGSMLNVQEYITYSMSKPRIWPANAAEVYSWWVNRAAVQISPSYRTIGNQSVMNLSITGASDPQTAVEILLPRPTVSGLQVFTNGVMVSGSGYRTNGQTVKVLVGTSVTNVEIDCILNPTARGDSYSAAAGSSLTVAAPGVLGNDEVGLGASLTAVLLDGPANGTLTLNGDGSFSYTPNAGYSGIDSFTYVANDSISTSPPAVVTIDVTPPGSLFFDDFSRATAADPLAPWVAVLGNWTISNGVLQGISSGSGEFANALVPGSWGDYSVEGRIQFPPNGAWAGLAGRVDTVSGASYSAVVYPEWVEGGTAFLRLWKFTSLETFVTTPMQEVSLPNVGTNWHSLKLTMVGNQLRVYFDRNPLINVTDNNYGGLPAYTSGGIATHLFTPNDQWVAVFDDINVSTVPSAANDSYTAIENTTLTVPAPGVLNNDEPGLGTNLTAIVITGPTNGSLTLNSDGSFNYTPAINYLGLDNFTYQANDGVSNSTTALVVLAVVTNGSSGVLVITADNQSRIYGVANPTFTGTLTGLQNGDNITATYSTIASNRSAVGSYAIVPTLQDPDGKLANYGAVIINNGTLTVTAATLTVSATSTDKVYDGATAASVSLTDNRVPGDNLSTGFASANFADKNVGSGKNVTVSGITISGPDAGNYVYNSSAVTTASITTRSITVTAASNSKVYDATVSAAAIPAITSGSLASGDTANFSETYDTKNVGSGKTLLVTAYTVSDGNSGSNYAVTTLNNTSGVVSKAALTITAAANTKVYDGNTNAVATPTVSGLQGGDGINGLAESYGDRNVGMGKTLLVTAYTVNDGNGGNNYAVSLMSSANGVITGRVLTVSASAANKIYDGTTSATVTLSDDRVSGDDLTVSEGAANFSDKNVGTNKTVTVTGITISGGANAGDYTLGDAATNTTANISVRSLTLTAVANTKTYDGGVSAAATPTVSGLQTGDSVSGLAEVYSDKNVGTNKTLSVSAYTVNDGSSGNNYTVTTQNNLNGEIDAAGLTITAVANTKTYDGGVSAGAVPTVSGLQTGDSVNGLAEVYADKNVGTNKTLNVTGYTVIDGNGGSNYTVTAQSNGSGEIDAAGLTITAAANIKTYDGGVSAAATPTVSGLQSGDSVSGLVEAYADKNVGTNKTLNVTGYTVIDGNGGSNYTVTAQSNGSGEIDAAGLTITAAANIKTYDGGVSAAATPTVSGLQSGDSVSGLVEAYADKNVGTNKTLNVTGYTVIDGNGGNNYAVSLVSASSGVITGRLLTVSASAANKIYDGTTTASVTLSDDRVSGDDLTVSAGGANFSDKNVGTNKTVNMTGITISGGANAGDYTVGDGATNTTANISVRGLTLTAVANTKTYDGGVSAAAVPSVSGLQSGDSVTGLAEVYGDKKVGVGKTLSVSAYTVNDGNSGNNYTVTTQNNLSGEIDAATLTVTADNKSRNYGDANPPLTATYSGFATGDTSAVLSGSPSLSTTATASSPVGSYPIAVSTGTLSAVNYDFVFVNGLLSVLNTTPVLPAQLGRAITDLTILIVTNTATDSDVPAPTLTYQLIAAPAGAAIDANGIITWTPSLAQSPSTSVITTVVTENGVPSLSATNSFTVTVSGPYDGIDLTDPVQALADYDGDGLSNLLEYGLGTNPRDPSDAQGGLVTSKVINGGAQYLLLEFKRRRSSSLPITYVPEVSADGVTWFSDGAHIVQVNVVPFDAYFDWVTFQDQVPTTAAAPRFVRLRVVEN